MTQELDILKQDLETHREVVNYIPIADLMAEAGSKNASELQELALIIRDCPDLATVSMAILLFHELLQQEPELWGK